MYDVAGTESRCSASLEVGLNHPPIEADILADLDVRKPFRRGGTAGPGAVVHPALGHLQQCGDVVHGEELVDLVDLVDAVGAASAGTVRDGKPVLLIGHLSAFEGKVEARAS